MGKKKLSTLLRNILVNKLAYLVSNIHAGMHYQKRIIASDTRITYRLTRTNTFGK